jgi:deoxyribonuclease IV
MLPLIGGHAPVSAGLARGVAAYVETTGAEAVQVFAANPRGWAHSPGDPAQDAALRAYAARAGLPVFVHAPYLINLGSPDPVTAARSAAAVRHSLRRGAEIGAAGVVVHTGSAVRGSRAEGLRRVAAALGPVLAAMGDEVPGLLLEPTAGQGRMLCGRVEDLGPYLDALGRHPRLGVCLDTCHLFAAGHDLTAPGGVAGVFAALAAAAGPGRLKLVHANDSAGPCGSHTDRHARIGSGLVGAQPFIEMIFHPDMTDVPMIVETPGAKDSREHALDISLLKRLRAAADSQAGTAGAGRLLRALCCARA